jgi:hypothetical protein
MAIVNRTSDVPVYSIAPQPTTLQRAPGISIRGEEEYKRRWRGRNILQLP